MPRFTISNQPGTCGSCKYKGDPIIIDEGDEDEIDTGLFKCTRIKHFKDRYSMPLDNKAYARDASGYFACLLTADDFGCSLYEPKETPLRHLETEPQERDGWTLYNENTMDWRKYWTHINGGSKAVYLDYDGHWESSGCMKYPTWAALKAAIEREGK
jgi:hypothetical protein